MRCALFFARLWLLVGFWIALFGCGRKESPKGPVAEIGVFYGGQVQRLGEVEFSTVQPPKIGFRIWANWAPGDTREKPVVFQLVRPGSAGRRVTKEGTLVLRPGQEKLDHVFDVAPDSRLGLWNVRIVVGDRLVADRALRLVPVP